MADHVKELLEDLWKGLSLQFDQDDIQSLVEAKYNTVEKLK